MSLFSLRLLNKTFTVIWHLKPLISLNKSLNKSLILDLLDEPDNRIWNKTKTNPNNNILLQEKFQTNKSSI